MAENKNSFLKTTLNAGALLGLALIMYSLIIYFLNLNINKIAGYLTYVIIIAGIIFLQIQHRDKVLNGRITYGQALGFAVMTLLFAGIISAIFSFIEIKFIDPGIVDKILNMQEESMTKRGMNTDQIEMAMRMTKRMMTPLMMSIFSFIGIVFWGTIISLITSAIVRKEGDPFAADTKTGDSANS